jgi:hypothetical protein
MEDKSACDQVLTDANLENDAQDKLHNRVGGDDGGVPCSLLPNWAGNSPEDIPSREHV